MQDEQCPYVAIANHVTERRISSANWPKPPQAIRHSRYDHLVDDVSVASSVIHKCGLYRANRVTPAGHRTVNNGGRATVEPSCSASPNSLPTSSPISYLALHILARPGSDNDCCAARFQQRSTAPLSSGVASDVCALAIATNHDAKTIFNRRCRGEAGARRCSPPGQAARELMIPPLATKQTSGIFTVHLVHLDTRNVDAVKHRSKLPNCCSRRERKVGAEKDVVRIGDLRKCAQRRLACR